MELVLFSLEWSYNVNIYFWILAKSPSYISERSNKQNLNTKINSEGSNKMEQNYTK